MESSLNLQFRVLARLNDKFFLANSVHRQVDRWNNGTYLPQKKDGSGWINHEYTRDANLYVEMVYPSLFNPTIKVFDSHGYNAWEDDNSSIKDKSVVVKWSGFIFMFDIVDQVFSVRKINIISHGLEVSVEDREIFRKENIAFSPSGNFLVKSLGIPEESFLNDGNFAVDVGYMCSIASHQHRSLLKSKKTVVV